MSKGEEGGLDQIGNGMFLLRTRYFLGAKKREGKEENCFSVCFDGRDLDGTGKKLGKVRSKH